MPNHTTTVRIGADHYAAEIRTEAHTLTADEPRPAGGGDTGPNPYELLLAALGACKAITIRMYADRKGWPLEEATIRLAHDRRHASDCERCDDTEPRLDHIDAELILTGDLTAEQRRRLAEIADRCPVHRTITGDLRIKTSLRET